MKTEEDHEALAKFGFLTSAHWKHENLEDGVEIDSNGQVHFDGFSQPLMPANCLKSAFGEASKALNTGRVLLLTVVFRSMRTLTSTTTGQKTASQCGIKGSTETMGISWRRQADLDHQGVSADPMVS